MKVLLVHNAYQQRGGEDSVVDSEEAMLTRGGHEVIAYRRHNDEVQGASRLSLLATTVWSRQSEADVASLIEQHRPDVMHLHNSLPLVSPSVIWAASQRGVPVVMTLHNFRLLCPQAMFLREGKVCEDCLGGVPWRAVTRACYRESPAQTAVMVGSLMVHRWLGTYQRHVDQFIALSAFARGKFLEAGFDAQRLSVKPNFVEEDASGPWVPDAARARLGGMFVGRLAPEKGVDVLAQAAPWLPAGCIDVVGDGPLAPRLQGQAALNLVGFKALPEVLQRMQDKSFLLLPSICYENFPRTIAEAFSKGLPVIASRLGGMAEIIDDGQTGLHFEAGNARDLAEKVNWALSHPDAMRQMGERARQVYEARFTEAVNLQALLAIYQQAMAHFRTR